MSIQHKDDCPWKRGFKESMWSDQDEELKITKSGIAVRERPDRKPIREVVFKFCPMCGVSLENKS